jgi:hypothetical protein
MRRRPSDDSARNRRWAIEQLALNAPVDSMRDSVQHCVAAMALIDFVQTGRKPEAVPSEVTRH